MKTKTYFSVIAILACIVLCCFSCNDDDDKPTLPVSNENYILVTNNGQIAPNPTMANMRVTYLPDIKQAMFDCSNYPTVEYANTSGFRRVYKDKWLFVTANKKGDRGIQKYTTDNNGKLKDAGFIPFPFPSHLLPVRFCIANDNKGYYITQLDPFIVHTFDPSTMLKLDEKIDLEQAIIAFKPNIETEFKDKLGAEKPFLIAGQETILYSNGKIFVNVHYGHTKGKGVHDSLYDEFYLAVIDAKTNQFEKIISLSGIYNQGLPPLENPFYTKTSDGSVYFISLQWNNYDPIEGIKLKAMDESQLFKLGANGEFDPTWRLKPSDIDGKQSQGDKRRVFESVITFENDLYVSVSRSGIKPYALGNIKNTDFEIYRINTETKKAIKIDIPISTPNAPSGSFYKIDNELFIRVVNPTSDINGFYRLNKDKTTTSKVFDVTKNSGIVFSLIKLKK